MITRKEINEQIENSQDDFVLFVFLGLLSPAVTVLVLSEFAVERS
jgi:hypothetical protein